MEFWRKLGTPYLSLRFGLKLSQHGFVVTDAERPQHHSHAERGNEGVGILQQGAHAPVRFSEPTGQTKAPQYHLPELRGRRGKQSSQRKTIKKTKG